MTARLVPFAALLIIGCGWGLSVALTRIAMTADLAVFGVIFWQLVVAILVLAPISILQNGRLRVPPFWGYFLIIALLGTLIPNSFSYRAAAELQGGVMAILIALVPMFALPIALLIGAERFEARRGLGVVFGALAVIFLIGPEASLPRAGDWIFVLVGAVAPLCYAMEANYVARRGLDQVSAVDVLLFASIIGLILITPITLSTDAMVPIWQPWRAAEWALLGLSLLHAGSYVGYVWLVNRAGAVFASQVAYIVTFSGVGWSILLLGERYSIWVWAAVLVMMAGVFLVQPRERDRG